MSFEWKMPAVIAAGAFVLAALIGIFAGASFWILLLRALLTGAGCGLAGFGLRALAQRFLAASGANEGAAEVQAERGRNVDLRVGGDEVPAEQSAGEGKSREPAGPGPAAEDEELSRDDGFTEELEELKASPILKGATEEDDSTYEPVRPPDAIDDVDVLPDLDVFTDAFAPPTLEGEAEAPLDSAPSRSSGGSGRGQAGGDDPNLLAQAVRTILTRERKG